LNSTETADCYHNTYSHNEEVPETEIGEEGEYTCRQSHVSYHIADDYTKASNDFQKQTTSAVNRTAEYLTYGIARPSGQKEIEEPQESPQCGPGNPDHDRRAQSHYDSFDVLLWGYLVGWQTLEAGALATACSHRGLY